MSESLLAPQKNRFVLFPIKYDEIWRQYKRQISCFWTVEEVSLATDKVHWEKLSSNEQKLIKYVLAFFAGSDGIVLENLLERFTTEIEIPEVRCFYGFQAAMENIHSEMYSLLIDTYITDPSEKETLFNAIEDIPVVKKKAEWALKWIGDKEASYAKRLIAFAVVEGIFFSGSFCAIFWLKERGLMPGLTFSNELISRDEGFHTEFATLLYSMIQHRLSQDEVFELFEEAVEIEKEFIIDAVPCSLIGMNSRLMSQYIEFCADRLLVQLGYEKRWNSTNPFDFMELISMRTKTNFFEKKVAEYVKSGVGKTEEDNEFSISDDF